MLHLHMPTVTLPTVVSGVESVPNRSALVCLIVLRPVLPVNAIVVSEVPQYSCVFVLKFLYFLLEILELAVQMLLSSGHMLALTDSHDAVEREGSFS
jgi:hypothetical protein